MSPTSGRTRESRSSSRGGQSGAFGLDVGQETASTRPAVCQQARFMADYCDRCFASKLRPTCSLLNVCGVPALRSEWYLERALGQLEGVGDVRRSKKAPRSKRGALEVKPVGHLWSGRVAQEAEIPPSSPDQTPNFVNEYKAKSAELTGFEPVAPSLRKMHKTL